MMEYNYPNQGFALVNDQFMVGDKILVAPILTSGTSRKVVLPKGKWRDEIHGKIITGPRTIQITASLEELPYFIKK